MLAGVTDPDHQGEIGYVWNTGGHLGHLLVLSRPVIKADGKLQRSNSSRTTNGPDPSGMTVWVPPPGKEPQQAKCLLRAKEIQNG